MAHTTPVNLITGPLGAGKTSLIRQLLAQVPAGERWAVLINEFGQVGIDAASLAGGPVPPDLILREVPGGCLCCSAQLPMRQAIVELIRRARPDRLLIEPSGVSHPAGIVDVLRDPFLAPAVYVDTVVGVFDATAAGPERLAAPGVRALLELAEVVAVTKVDRAPRARLEQLYAACNALYPPKRAVLQAPFGQLDPRWLRRASAQAGSPHASQACAEAPSPVATATAEAGHGRGQRLGEHQHAAHTWTWGQVFGPEIRFSAKAVRAVFEGLAEAGRGTRGHAGLRVKGIFRTERRWLLFNLVGAHWDEREVGYRVDSRVEVIAQQIPPGMVESLAAWGQGHANHIDLALRQAQIEAASAASTRGEARN